MFDEMLKREEDATDHNVWLLNVWLLIDQNTRNGFSFFLPS